jgi:hypothetical protein
MKATRKLTPVQEAAGRANEGMKMLRELGFQRMEVTQDKAGIEWSRWIRPFDSGYLHMILWATPHGWDVFEAVTYENSVEATRKGIERAIAEH